MVPKLHCIERENTKVAKEKAMQWFASFIS